MQLTDRDSAELLQTLSEAQGEDAAGGPATRTRVPGGRVDPAQRARAFTGSDPRHTEHAALRGR